MKLRLKEHFDRIKKALMIILGAILLLLLVVLFVFLSASDRSIIFGGYEKFDYAGTERKYVLQRPQGEVKEMVIGLHGFGDTAKRFAYYTSLHNVVDDNTLVIYPEASAPKQTGIKKGWNAGFCCGSGFVGDVDDAGFLKTLIEKLKEEYASQSVKVYITGFSNGAFMSQRMATDYPELIDGVAISSGSIGTTQNKLEPQQAVPILLMHGEKDTIVPFNGGVGSSDPDFDWLPFDKTKSVWQQLNEGKAETKIITYPENAHKWDGWRIVNIWHKRPNASIQAINFFDSL